MAIEDRGARRKAVGPPTGGTHAGNGRTEDIR